MWSERNKGAWLEMGFGGIVGFLTRGVRKVEEGGGDMMVWLRWKDREFYLHFMMASKVVWI